MSTTTIMHTRSINQHLTTLSVPFLRFDKIKFGGRATLIKLGTGDLAVFSPVSLTPAAKAAVQSLGGEVRYIIAPDIEHHLNLTAWKQAYPAARVLGPEGLREKRAKAGIEDVPIDYEFTKANKRELALPEDFAHDLDVEYWDGHVNKEIALLHKPSKTLIEADVLFNLPANEQFAGTGVNASSGVWTKLMHYFTNTRPGHIGQNRFNWYIASGDKASFGESAKRVAAWDFDRVIPCHGDVIETGGNAAFRRVFSWYL